MKTYVFFLILLLPFFTEAKEVSQQEAIRIALVREQYLCGEDFPRQVQAVRVIEQDGQKVYYIIQFEPEGWALIAADDQASPVVAYSPIGVYDERDQSEGQQWWLEGQIQRIRKCTENPNKNRHPGWDNPVQTRAVGKIAPMIEVNWNQDAPYNAYCPLNAQGERAVVGCVAVAMAQVMTVYKEPQRGTGRNAYESNAEFGVVDVDFDQEKPYDWEAILAGTDNQDETARLLFHCGVAVHMNYGISASGSYSNRIPSAIRAHFDIYDENIQHIYQSVYSGDWIELILNELSEGRPMVYNATNDTGTSSHSFNLDGFDGAGSFHINWGWGGKNNGYYTLENLEDGDFNYLNNHGAVIGFMPKDHVIANTETPSSPIHLYIDAGALYIETSEDGRYQLYNISGQMVNSGSFQPGMKDLLNGKKLSPSIYLLRLQYGKREEVQKVVIH